MSDNNAWWLNKRKELLEIANQKGAAYVYDREHLKKNIGLTKNIKGISSVFFAMKANNNADILYEFYKTGLNFECVSIGEVEYVQRIFPGLDPKKILFTPNFAPKHEYKKALELGIWVTIDNIYPLQHWPELFKNKDLFLRIDTGNGLGHHKYVKTGGKNSKFGIPSDSISQIKKIIKKINANVIGLHAHSGSGITDSNLWAKTAQNLNEIAQNFEAVKYLNIGGGFAIHEDEIETKSYLKSISQSLKKNSNSYSEYELWIEPGRLLTATAGVLLTTVTQLKQKNDVQYVGVNTGMNSLIRPALYNAHHPIVNLSKWDEPSTHKVNIVGPICETGDTLGTERDFPDSQEGDIVLIANAGAYGQVMSSNYNMRPPTEEVVI